MAVIAPLIVNPANVGVAVESIFCGVERVTLALFNPEPATKIWFAVPAMVAT